MTDGIYSQEAFLTKQPVFCKLSDLVESSQTALYCGHYLRKYQRNPNQTQGAGQGIEHKPILGKVKMGPGTIVVSCFGPTDTQLHQ